MLFEVEQEVRSRPDDTTAALSDADVLALYERWLATGSRAAARRLAALGMLPARGPEDAC